MHVCTYVHEHTHIYIHTCTHTKEGYWKLNGLKHVHVLTKNSTSLPKLFYVATFLTHKKSVSVLGSLKIFLVTTKIKKKETNLL